ncbi:uncharacterized protein LOC129962367 [Argiope bruennichi]|uniref:uncharacterized protein LOC129962367 n=1 Tax=Argiope bruennichi TaxID=94029 RepID=UPI002494DB43|nr:uncharacterized protein LOC129962367 [Argiope bruennichi]
MSGYQDLSDFQRGLIIGAREMGRSISEATMKFVFSHTTISNVYREYQVSGKTSNLRQRCSRKTTLTERDHRWLKKIVTRDRRSTLPQIAADLNACPSTSVRIHTVQRTLIDMGCIPSRIPLFTQRHKALHFLFLGLPTQSLDF